MSSDLQKEVERLKAEVERKHKALVDIYNRLPIVRTTEPIVVSGLLYDIGEMAFRGMCSAQTPRPAQAKEKESCACKLLTKSGPLTPEMMERAFFPERFADKEPLLASAKDRVVEAAKAYVNAINNDTPEGYLHWCQQLELAVDALKSPQKPETKESGT